MQAFVELIVLVELVDEVRLIGPGGRVASSGLIAIAIGSAIGRIAIAITLREALVAEALSAHAINLAGPASRIGRTTQRLVRETGTSYGSRSTASLAASARRSTIFANSWKPSSVLPYCPEAYRA
jgi:hypothetical protein